MKQAILEKAILATIVYYNALGNYPLTSFEIYKYLTNPPISDIECPSGHSMSKCKLNQIIDTLDSSQKLKGLVGQKNGFYFLKNQKQAVEERIERQKIADKKWKKIRKIAKWLQVVPYIKMIAVSGSLAINNTRKESDLDVLISTKYGRIWTSRALLSGLTQLIGQRRHGRVIKDKICLNQYTTDQFPEMPLKNLSNAHHYGRLVPLFDTVQYQKFLKNNQWIKDYLPFCSFSPKAHLKTIKQNKSLKLISQILEFFLDTKAGDFFEKKLGQWQKRRIVKKVDPKHIAFNLDDFKQKNNPVHLSLSDEALIFHYPISRNLEVQNKYFIKMADLNNKAYF